jgi:hypothetical protein
MMISPQLQPNTNINKKQFHNYNGTLKQTSMTTKPKRCLQFLLLLDDDEFPVCAKKGIQPPSIGSSNNLKNVEMKNYCLAIQWVLLCPNYEQRSSHF